MPVARDHHYQVNVVWTGNQGQGTATYEGYSRGHQISAPDKPPIPGTTYVQRFQDHSAYTPEELMVGALSACHMMWLLHLCAEAGITVTSYVDDPSGTVRPEGQTGQFSEVTLRPRMRITNSSRISEAEALHQEAHRLCNAARSVNFPVHCVPSVAAD